LPEPPVALRDNADLWLLWVQYFQTPESLDVIMEWDDDTVHKVGLALMWNREIQRSRGAGAKSGVHPKHLEIMKRHGMI